MFKRLLAVLMMFGFTGATVGCNTIAGAGKDIERGGEAVHDTAKDVQNKV